MISVDNNFFQNTCFKEGNNIKVKKLHREKANFYEKNCLPLITWYKNHLSKQSVQVTYTLDEKFFCSCYFCMFISYFFPDRVKNL